MNSNLPDNAAHREMEREQASVVDAYGSTRSFFLYSDFLVTGHFAEVEEVEQ